MERIKMLCMFPVLLEHSMAWKLLTHALFVVMMAISIHSQHAVEYYVLKMAANGKNIAMVLSLVQNGAMIILLQQENHMVNSGHQMW